MDLYEKIKELAKQKNVSIRQIEENLNWGNGVIGRWKKAKPSYDKLEAIADYFHVSVDYLLGREEIKGEVLNKDEKDMLLAFRLESNNMSEEKRKAFKKSLKTLMKSAREIAEDDSFWED